MHSAQKQILNVSVSLERSLDTIVFNGYRQTALLQALLDEMKSQRMCVRIGPLPSHPSPPFQANDDDDDNDDDDGGDDGNDRRPPGLRYVGPKGGKGAPASDANKENAPPARGSRSASANARSQAASSSSSSSASVSSSKKRSAPDTPYEDESAHARLRRFPTEDSDETKEYSEVDDDIVDDDDDDDDDDGDGGGGFDSQGSSAASASTQRRTRVMWTKEEERALRNGVASEGYGKWEKILDWDACNKRPFLQRKTAVQLKDKARLMGLE
jgi:hypothetical protein